MTTGQSKGACVSNERSSRTTTSTTTTTTTTAAAAAAAAAAIAVATTITISLYNATPHKPLHKPLHTLHTPNQSPLTRRSGSHPLPRTPPPPDRPTARPSNGS